MQIKIIALLLAMLILFSGCATVLYEGDGSTLPPILAQDELIKPYTQIAKINISVDLYLSSLPDLNEWGYRTLREEAHKMGGDAVILPELSSNPAPHLIIPANEYRAKGVVIKFK